MDSTTQELKQLSTLNALAQYGSDDLLAAFLASYNQQNADWDEMVSDNQRLQQERDGYKRQCNAQIKEIEELKQESEFCRDMALQAEDIANKSTGVQQELNRSKAMVKSLQNELKELKKLNPKKLKEQNKRQQQKAIEKDKRIRQAEAALKDAGKALEKSRAETQQAIAKIAELQKQLAHDTGAGLYHNNKDHLIIWPQKTKMQRPDGSIFEGRSLLYLHQSGRGGLITNDPDNGSKLCAAPPGGLRPGSDTIDFAQDWLFKVNELQEGLVREEDMIPVNYNGNFDGKAA
ncbi:MAG: hypothetical protein CML20_22945 [Rheinheimera sp.]|nr:hypothetical protein [Rheinheimera sp.]|tara:strand:- start:18676 stop:19545 length:870 start_codon:yes stop_codon:yes gene_type:complete